jgi:hypothetical protein
MELTENHMQSSISLWGSQQSGEESLTVRDFPPGLKMKRAIAAQEVRHRARNVAHLQTAEEEA